MVPAVKSDMAPTTTPSCAVGFFNLMHAAADLPPGIARAAAFSVTRACAKAEEGAAAGLAIKRAMAAATTAAA